MSLFEKELNDLLVQVYRSIGQMEEQMVRMSHHMNLSICWKRLEKHPKTGKGPQ